MFDRVDEQQMLGFISWENNDNEEVETSFPLVFTVCRRCEGKGKHCDPMIDGNGITQEDFNADPAFQEAYFSGRYDVVCEECSGRRVTLSIHPDSKFDDEQEAAFEYIQMRAEHDAEDRQIMRMESGVLQWLVGKQHWIYGTFTRGSMQERSAPKVWPRRSLADYNETDSLPTQT